MPPSRSSPPHTAAVSKPPGNTRLVHRGIGGAAFRDAEVDVVAVATGTGARLRRDVERPAVLPVGQTAGLSLAYPVSPIRLVGEGPVDGARIPVELDHPTSVTNRPMMRHGDPDVESDSQRRRRTSPPNPEWWSSGSARRMHLLARGPVDRGIVVIFLRAIRLPNEQRPIWARDSHRR